MDREHAGRGLQVNKENVKLKAADGKTLLHRLCLSTRHLPHTEFTVRVDAVFCVCVSALRVARAHGQSLSRSGLCS